MTPGVRWLVLLGLPWLLASCCALPGAGSVLCSEPCAVDGTCSVRTFRAGDSPYRCYAGSDAECAGSEACTKHGRCSATEQGTCVSASSVPNHTCARSRDCSLWGRCSSDQGTCVARSDADCAASFECTTQGRCKVSGGVCVPGSDADCQQSTGCRFEGFCAYAGAGLYGNRCLVPLDDPKACQQSWACANHGRCTPTPFSLPNGRKSQVGACASDAQEPQPSCAIGAHNVSGCLVDGWCARDAAGVCRSVPNPNLPAPVPPGPASRPLDPPVTAGPVASASPKTDPSTGMNVSTNAGTNAKPTGEVADTPPGPGSVQYDLTLDGDRYTGTLTYASVLTGLKGFRDDPIDPIDLLVLRTVPGDTCRPKSTSLIPLDAVWVLEPLPDSPGTHTLTPGPMPGDTSAKTWTWDGKTGASHNMGLDGTVTVTRTLANGRLEGTIDVVARPYFETTTLGTLRGGFVAQPIDCSTWTGGFPM